MTAQRTIRDGNRAPEVIQRLRAMFVREQPPIEAVDLIDAACEVLALSASELQGARVAVRTGFAEGLPPVWGDRVQLQQVILNPVLNAADALREVQGRPRKLAVTTARGMSGEVTLSVTTKASSPRISNGCSTRSTRPRARGWASASRSSRLTRDACGRPQIRTGPA